ncbi:MAG: hypothetical protein RMJ57_07650 [Bacteroidia bacterium]|nr:hypothetical protein [Bacteroidia bacterium]
MIQLRLPSGGLVGRAELPFSKSLSNRQLIVGAHTGAPFTIEGLSEGEDTYYLLRALAALGYIIQRDGIVWTFLPPSSYPSRVELYTGEGGTTLRFLLPLLARLPLQAYVHVGNSLRGRPILPLLQSLQRAGAHVRLAPNTYPLSIVGDPEWDPTSFYIDSSLSSQFLSALMLMAPGLKAGTVIYELAQKPATPAYSEMTRKLLQLYGWNWQQSENSWQLETSDEKQKLYAFRGERDWSAASFFFGWAALGAFSGTLPLSLESIQPEARLFSSLQWGYTITPASDEAFITPLGEPLHGKEIEVENYPDAVLVLSVIAAVAENPTRLRGIHTLPYKETDRLQALITELSKIGATLVVQGEDLIVYPTESLPKEPIVLESYGDHRTAMALSLLAARMPAVIIKQHECVSKSFPRYWVVLESLGAECRII